MPTFSDPDHDEEELEAILDNYKEDELSPEEEIYDPADDEDCDFDDAGAFRDCGWGTDEDYGCF